MTDLHTHILPGMDDGAKTVEISLEMLRMSYLKSFFNICIPP